MFGSAGTTSLAQTSLPWAFRARMIPTLIRLPSGRLRFFPTKSTVSKCSWRRLRGTEGILHAGGGGQALAAPFAFSAIHHSHRRDDANRSPASRVVYRRVG